MLDKDREALELEARPTHQQRQDEGMTAEIAASNAAEAVKESE